MLATGQLAVLDLDTGDVRRLGVAGVHPRYVSTGHVVYASQDASLRALPFDLASLEVTGSPVPLFEGIKVQPVGSANFDISDNGRLVYLSGTTDISRTSLFWESVTRLPSASVRRATRVRTRSAFAADQRISSSS